MASGGVKREERDAKRRALVYCIVPRGLAGKLHEPLRRHWREDPGIEVVVERRSAERRRVARRAAPAAEPERAERRLIRAEDGRRVADRRAVAAPVPERPLPLRLRRYADSLTFVERVEPSSEAALDVDTARLVLSAQGGDAGAFRDIYLRYFDGVYTYARVVLDDHQEAEDVTQEVFMRALNALPRYTSRRGKPFRAWLFRIARNAAIDRMKKLGTLQVEEPDALTRRVEQRAPAGERRGAAATLDWASDSDLVVLIERLPQPQRQALALRYIVGLSAKEIAEVMGRSPEAVAQLQHRARRHLEERLAAIQRRGSGTPHRRPMLIRLRRMPVLRARRAAVRAPRRLSA